MCWQILARPILLYYTVSASITPKPNVKRSESGCCNLEPLHTLQSYQPQSSGLPEALFVAASDDRLLDRRQSSPPNSSSLSQKTKCKSTINESASPMRLSSPGLQLGTPTEAPGCSAKLRAPFSGCALSSRTQSISNINNWPLYRMRRALHRLSAASTTTRPLLGDHGVAV